MVLLGTAAIVGIVGWAASPVINRLIGKARSYATKKYKWHKSMVEKLESVAHFLDEIGSTVGLVEERRIASDPNMVCWLSQLKDAIEKVEDMFDRLDYEILKSSLPDTSHSARARHASGASSAESAAAGTSSAAGLSSSSSFTDLLEDLVKKLDDIRQSSRGLVQASLLAVAATASSSSGDRSGARRPVTGPLLPQEAEPLVGYDAQYEHLVTRLLLDDLLRLEGSSSSYDDDHDARVAIVGHGGMGKTALARRACNDARVGAHFDLLIWACVYGKLSEGDILGEIWRSAAQARDAETSFGSLVHRVARLELPAVWNALASARCGAAAGDMSFSSMQQALGALVASKRYLLVLDDVCNDETEATTELRRRETWSNVLAPFRRGKRGSRVLVTTRAEMCARTLGAGANRRLVLDGIGREPFVRLIKTTASSSSSSARGKHYHSADELDEVLRRSSASLSPAASAWKCKRSPLAAKAIGLKLRNTSDRNRWPEILNNTAPEDVMAAHVSSYQDLPPRLQCCLAFLSLFPNNFRFHPEMLVKMWVAHGFISDDDGGRSSTITMEDTAREYFNGLLSRSLLQVQAAPAEVEGTSKATTTCYVVHEEVHAMIRWVSANYFQMMAQQQQGDFSAKKIPLTVRHLSVTAGFLPHLSKHGVLKRLRTLVILRDTSSPSSGAGAGGTIDEDLTKDLRGVRMLDLTGTDITVLPKGIRDMVHLRYLALPATVKSFPVAANKLLHLQTLFRCSHQEAEVDHMNLHVDEDVAFKLCAKEAGLEHLAGMNSLRGSLSITGLDAVASQEDAQKAQLHNKKFVKVLKLEWDAPKAKVTAPVPDLGVLEGLQPHIDVQVLHIRRYRGTSSPNWLANNLLQLRLTHLYIVSCRKWEVLPPLGHLPCLNHLQIEQMNSLKQIDGSGLFISLETLVLSDMKRLVEWTTENSESTFAILKSIEISYCPELEKLPTTLTTLKPKVIECPKLGSHL